MEFIFSSQNIEIKQSTLHEKFYTVFIRPHCISIEISEDDLYNLKMALLSLETLKNIKPTLILIEGSKND